MRKNLVRNLTFRGCKKIDFFLNKKLRRRAIQSRSGPYFLRIQKVFGPFLVFANAVPKIAFAPILILWYGVDMGSKIALATIIVFFIVQMPTTASHSAPDTSLMEWLRENGEVALFSAECRRTATLQMASYGALFACIRESL